MSTMTSEREAFEKWVRRQSWFKATLGLMQKHDAYTDPCINSRWQGWQARAHLAKPAQATTCAGCGEHKATPLRIDAMGGYVCLTCIDQKLSSLLGEFGYPEPQPAQAVDVVAIREVIADMDCDMDMPVTADAWRDKLTLAISGEKSGPVDGWISATDRLPECDMTPNSFGGPVEVKPGFFDGVRRVPNAFYGCRQTDRPNFYLYGAVFYPTHWRYPASPAPDKEGQS